MKPPQSPSTSSTSPQAYSPDFVLGGLAYSGVTPTNSAFCRAYFGPGHYPVNFPLINTNLIFASFGSTVSGALYDAGGSYNSTFFLIIGLAAVLV